MKSFFQSAKRMAKNAGNSIKAGVKKMRSFPTKMHCENRDCRRLMQIHPPQWICRNGHTSERASKTCTSQGCTEVKPRNLPPPKVRCPFCHLVQVVPSSNVALDLRNTKLQATGAYNRMVSVPTDFSCQHCGAKNKLAPGMWRCPKCQHATTEDKCENCSLKKYEMKVECTACREMTRIPKSNLRESLSSSYSSVKRSATKGYYALRKIKYVSCKSCKNTQKLPPELAEIFSGSSKASKYTKKQDSESKEPVELMPMEEGAGDSGSASVEGDEQKQTLLGDAPESDAPPPDYETVIGHEGVTVSVDGEGQGYGSDDSNRCKQKPCAPPGSIGSVVCEKCKNDIYVVLPPPKFKTQDSNAGESSESKE